MLRPDHQKCARKEMKARTREQEARDIERALEWTVF
jgi:hypothetical protein